MVSTEVVSAVQQLLENEGVLQSIRAQLRASVINALSTKSSENKISKTNEYLATETGRCSLLCIMDLMQKLNLRESMSVFEAEIGMNYTQLSIETKGDALMDKLSSRNDEPMLCGILNNLTDNKAVVVPQAQRPAYNPSPERESRPLTISVQSPNPDSPSSRDSPGFNPIPRSNIIGGTVIPSANFGRKSSPDASTRGPASDDFSVLSPEAASTGSRDSPGFGAQPRSSSIGGPTIQAAKLDRKSFSDLPTSGPAGDDFGESFEDSVEESSSFAAESKDRESPMKSPSPQKKGLSSPSASSVASIKSESPQESPKKSVDESPELRDHSHDGSKSLRGGVNVVAVSSLDDDRFQRDGEEGGDSPKGATIQRTGGGTTRSRFGWNNSNNRRDDSDDYMFSESPGAKEEGKGASPEGNRSLGRDQGRDDKEADASDQEMDDDDNDVLDSPSPAARTTDGPSTRHSWMDGKDQTKAAASSPQNQEQRDVSVDEDQDQDADVDYVVEDDDDDDDPSPVKTQTTTTHKSNNQEDDEEDRPSSLFMSRTQSGALPAAKASAGTTSTSPTSPTKSSLLPRSNKSDYSANSFEDDDDADDIELEAGEDSFVSSAPVSPSRKLSEVEKKIADMERQDKSLAMLRKNQNQKEGDASPVANSTPSRSPKADKDGSVDEYGEDFEEEGEGGGDFEVESVASEVDEIEEMSVGGADDDDDKW